MMNLPQVLRSTVGSASPRIPLPPLLLAFLLVLPTVAEAQEETGEAPEEDVREVAAEEAHEEAQEAAPEWDVEAELGAAVFFGNTSQTTFTTRMGVETADSVREFEADGRFSYGEATNQDGVAVVNKRSWTLATSFDHRPYGRWSPFLSGELERSYERRIDLRYNLGAGGKYTVQRSERGRLDVSAALLAEQTHPAEEAAEEFDDSLLARWSVRGRARRSWDDGRLVLESENSWRPRFDHAGDFTFTSSSSLAFELNDTVSLKLTFVDNYDSEAEERGARTNNDGQFFVTLLSSF